MLTMVSGVVTALLLGAAPPMPAEVETRFRVVDEGQRPIAEASIYANIVAGNDVINRQLTTDADGIAVVRRRKDARSMRVWADKPGYAGLFRGWEREARGGVAVMPDTFTFPMPKATTAGGRVVDQKGRGVPGVRLEVDCVVGGKMALPNGISYAPTLAHGSMVMTDKDGRWRLDTVPVPATALSLRIAHPDYVSDVRYGEYQKAQGVTMAQLRAGGAVIRLAAGAHVSGTVTDAAGKPVPKALVVYHDEPGFAQGRHEVLTDERGKYALPTLKPGKHPITVIARGHMPQLREVTVIAGPGVEDFRLGAGKTLRVKVVDEAGKPVKAAFVFSSWRGKKSLRPKSETGIPYYANAEGLYEWTWAPADAVTFWVFAKGLQTKMNLPLIADEGVQTLTMRPVPAVAGRVTDARTGEPIGKFHVYRVIEFSPGRYHVERSKAIDGVAGAYHTALERDDVDYRVLVEADGYRTALSQPSLVKSRSKAVDFKLEPAAPVRGRVLDPDGKPLAGARVSLATAVQGFSYPDGHDHLSVLTDKAGAFSLPAQAERFSLFVDHDKGTARLDRRPDEAIGDVTARPWAAIGGVLWQDGKPVPGQQVSLRRLARLDGDYPDIPISLHATTDQDGAFSFPRVPAGPLTVSAHLGPWEPSPLTSSESVALDAKPGEAVRLDLGKSGATLLGTVKLEGDLPKGLDLTYSLNWLTRKTTDIPKLGLDLRKDGRRLLLAREDEVYAHRRFFVKPTAEGRFRIVGVPPGEYWFTTRVYEKPEG